jgi:hypothetical protein
MEFIISFILEAASEIPSEAMAEALPPPLNLVCVALRGFQI